METSPPVMQNMEFSKIHSQEDLQGYSSRDVKTAEASKFDLTNEQLKELQRPTSPSKRQMETNQASDGDWATKNGAASVTNIHEAIPPNLPKSGGYDEEEEKKPEFGAKSLVELSQTPRRKCLTLAKYM